MMNDLSYIMGSMDRSWSMIRTDQDPQFGMHLIGRLMRQITCSSDFKPQEATKPNSIRSSGAFFRCTWQSHTPEACTRASLSAH